MIQDEKPKLESNGGEKIILSDIPEEQENSSPLFDESSISKEEFSSPVFDNPSLVRPGDAKDNESSQEIEVITNMDEAIEADNQRPILGIEEEEKECQGDRKIIVKECEEGVEAANVKVETQLIEERKSPTNGNQEITCSSDNPTDLEPDDVNDVNKNEELERPLSTESNEVMGSDEESGSGYGDQTVIEDTQKMQLNEEQESPTSGDQEVIVSDSSIPRINACEVKQQDCLMAVLDDLTSFKAENVSTNEERSLSTESEQAMATDEEFEAAYSSSGSKFVFDNPTDLEPEDVNENKELERPLSAESNQVMCRDEEFEAAYGDHIVIEDTPHLQLNEEQESPTTGDQEVICSDSVIPGINTCEVKQQDCLIAAFDGPTAFENASTNKERPLSSKSDQVMGRDEEFEAANGDQISIHANSQMQATEELKEEENGDVVVEKCVVVLEAPHSAQIAVEDDDHKVLVNGDQEISPFEKSTLESSPLENTTVNVQEFCSTEPENVKQDDDYTEEAIEVMKEDEAIESACADQIAVEDNPPMQLIEEEPKEDNDGRYTAVVGAEAVETVVADMAEDNHPQMQYGEGGGQDEDDKEEKEIADADDEEESNDADDEEEEIGDTDDENTSKKAEESSEGTGDSSMDSNAEAIWPAESMQEFSLKFKESKINNQNSAEKSEESKRVETEEHSYNNGGENGYKINEDKIKLTLPYKTEVATQNDQIVDSWKLKFFMFSILVPVVLVVLLLHRPTLFEALFHHDPL